MDENNNIKSVLFVTTGTEVKETCDIDGDGIRFGGKGVSGTEQSMISVAEQLASYGLRVVVAFPKANHKKMCRGVEYFDLFKRNTYIHDDFDMMIVPGWFKRFDLLKNVTIGMKFAIDRVRVSVSNDSRGVHNNRGIIGIWLACQFYDNRPLIEGFYGNNSVDKVLIHVSEWSKRAVCSSMTAGGYDNYKQVVIPNPYIDIGEDSTLVDKIPGSFVFHACWERGGSVAERIVKKCGGRLYRCDYHNPNFCMDKSKLYDVLKRCEYFVYPLVLLSGSVHRDTHACVVAEAMAHGVIVLTYPIAALKTSYPGDSMIYVDFPEGAKVEELMSDAPSVTDFSLLSESAVDKFCEKIKFLEANPWLKQQIRERAKNWVKNKFSEREIGKQWIENVLGIKREGVNDLEDDVKDKIIYSIFAGRHKNLELQFKYISRMLKQKLIDEVHIWDFTRNDVDSVFIREKLCNYHKSIRVFDVKNKNSWGEYYNYYTKEKFREGDILIKADDDIVYIDVDGFQGFINHVKNKDRKGLYVSPSIVNNGVTSHYHQKFELGLPKDIVGELEYATFFGRLVRDGKVANMVHDDFLKNGCGKYRMDVVLQHPVGDRISINFFAIMGKDFDVLQEVGWDDEHDVSVTIPKRHGRGFDLYMDLVVAHLGFSPQRDSGLDEDLIRWRYKQLLNRKKNNMY